MREADVYEVHIQKLTRTGLVCKTNKGAYVDVLVRQNSSRRHGPESLTDFTLTSELSGRRRATMPGRPHPSACDCG